MQLLLKLRKADGRFREIQILILTSQRHVLYPKVFLANGGRRHPAAQNAHVRSRFCQTVDVTVKSLSSKRYAKLVIRQQ